MLQGKIVVRDGKVYFALGFYLSSEEGKCHTNFWRLDVDTSKVTDGEAAYSPDSGFVKPEKLRGMGLHDRWRICNADGSFAPRPGSVPAAIGEDTDIPKPTVRKGVAVRWGHHGWEKYSRKDRGWVPCS